MVIDASPVLADVVIGVSPSVLFDVIGIVIVYVKVLIVEAIALDFNEPAPCDDSVPFRMAAFSCLPLAVLNGARALHT